MTRFLCSTLVLGKFSRLYLSFIFLFKFTKINGWLRASVISILSLGSFARSFFIRSRASLLIFNQNSSFISYLQSIIFLIISSGNSESNGKNPKIKFRNVKKIYLIASDRISLPLKRSHFYMWIHLYLNFLVPNNLWYHKLPLLNLHLFPTNSLKN